MIVRQRTYFVRQLGSLETQNILTCTALLGVHNASQSAFIAHLDTPKSVRGLSALAEDVRAITPDFKGWRVYTVNSAMLPSLFVISVVLAVAGVWAGLGFGTAVDKYVTWLPAPGIWGAAIAIGAFVCFFGQIVRTRRGVSRFAEETFGEAPTRLRHRSVAFGFGNVGVEVDGNVLGDPAFTEYFCKRERKLHCPPKAFDFRLRRSEEEADSNDVK